MRYAGSSYEFSATDLSNHLGCRHLTVLDAMAARKELANPPSTSAALEALKEKGMQHEKAYVASLEATGKRVAELPLGSIDASSVELTKEYMKSGADVIVQAALRGDFYRGRADILVRVEVPSELGEFSYEVLDTKLTRETRAGTMLQLCMYSEIIAGIQARWPEHMHVVSPSIVEGSPFAQSTYRVDEFAAYYRYAKARLEDGVEVPSEETYPEPCEQCDICRWWKRCSDRRRADDHLCLVAGLARSQRKELVSWNVETLESLAKLPLPIEKRPSRGTKESIERSREQARVQLEAREKNAPVYEIIPIEDGDALDAAASEQSASQAELRGFFRLPEPSAGDIYFDIEGNRFYENGGFEYLLGWVTVEGGEPQYHAAWAKTRAEEKAAFERFMKFAMAQWQAHPGMHIYHYGGYENGAIKRLSQRFGVFEQERDMLLRSGRMVDLHSISKQAIRAGVERYSIKDLEPLYAFEREVPLEGGNVTKRRIEYENAMEMKMLSEVDPETPGILERYNRDDCVSTLELHRWLEGRREEAIAEYGPIARPVSGDPEPDDKTSEREAYILDLAERLRDGIPLDETERTEAQAAQWLLADLVGFFWREDKAASWETFRLASLEPEELIDERKALFGLTFERIEQDDKGNSLHVYRYPPQDVAIKTGSTARIDGKARIGAFAKLDLRERRVWVKQNKKDADLRPESLFADERVPSKSLEQAVHRLAEWVLADGVEGDGEYRAARELLLGRVPRLRQGEARRAKGESMVDAAKRVASNLEQSVLPIQGPPGTGKSYTASRVIVDLVKQGKTCGITAVSHAVIRGLLKKVLEAAEEAGVDVQCFQKVRRETDSVIPGLTKSKHQPAALLAAQEDEHQVVGGTSWLFADKKIEGDIDVLFIDEAGQLSLANALAVSMSTESVILIGDPQQLEQPIQASHPEGAGVAALEHLLAGKKTIKEGEGLFLDTTYRLHPSVRAFTSELFYESRLASAEDRERQTLIGAGEYNRPGLHLSMVEHEGNTSSSEEEGQKVAKLFEGLLNASWRNHKNEEAKMTLDDILVVAPFNAQVELLRAALPDGARVGTVDKFQGQEAPVVIYSTATSHPEDAPRGMEFLYSLNRLNVATSRAKCVSILVSSPLLFEPDCKSPRQMRLANAFCRYLELAEEQASAFAKASA